MYGLTIAGSLLLGKFIYESRRARHAERDAVLRHYIELHPEDFPPIGKRESAVSFSH